jgi:hypothetical protein
MAKTAATRALVATTLVALGGLWAWATYAQGRLEDEVFPLAEECAKEIASPELETRSAITVSRDLLLAGTARAKVEVFGRKRDDASVVPQGFEFYYVKQGGKWVREGSGRCSSEHCVVRAKEVFGH